MKFHISDTCVENTKRGRKVVFITKVVSRFITVGLT